ncbi:ABC transporter permease subunit [Subtercola vilae]|uniref:ABC transporter permease subunit n=1 Tax=Subtercola vilae TaxID=2056433 RepID=UPI001EEEAC9F|nr:ABC transporter permease subunit [Subtercola vilae]
MGTVIRYEILNASRDRLPRTLLAVFLGMIAASSIIGWLTNQTVTAVYNQVLQDGLTIAPNPFTGVSPLRYMSNTVIYLVLIGALLASVAGVQATLRDRKMNTSDLVLSRPMSSVGYLAGKLAGQGAWLAIVLVISAATNWISIGVITGSLLPATNALQIMLFYTTGWAFLMGFVSIGMISGLRSKSEATALLLPILLWAVLVFVVPQLGTAAHPVSLLNPVATEHTERLADAEVVVSVGSEGDSYDNAMAEAFNPLFKAKLIRDRGPRRVIDDLEIAVDEYIDWFNQRRLHGDVGPIPPIEKENDYYSQVPVSHMRERVK